jgi:hypothetical protein
MTDKRKKRIRDLAEKLDVSRRSAANLLDAGRPHGVHEPDSLRTPMPTSTCLYCRETKDANVFNREHVLPEAFGKYEGNFVLKGVVCEACNTYFANHLDIKLARDSIEGLDRYREDRVRPWRSSQGPGERRRVLSGRGGLVGTVGRWP